MTGAVPVTSFHGFITNQFNDLFPVCLLAQVVRALHRYRRGQGFEYRTSLNFFSGFLLATAKVASITAMIYLHIITPVVVDNSSNERDSTFTK